MRVESGIGVQGPRFETVAESAEAWLLAASLSEELSIVQGHFPSAPLVPAFAQIEWVADELWGRLGAGEGMRPLEFRAVKYLQPLRVPSRIALEYICVSEGRYRFAIRNYESAPGEKAVVFTKGVCTIAL